MPSQSQHQNDNYPAVCKLFDPLIVIHDDDVDNVHAKECQGLAPSFQVQKRR